MPQILLYIQEYLPSEILENLGVQVFGGFKSQKLGWLAGMRKGPDIAGVTKQPSASLTFTEWFCSLNPEPRSSRGLGNLLWSQHRIH